MSEDRPTVCFVIPTRDRPDELQRTLDEVGRAATPGAEVFVVDNGSDSPPLTPGTLRNGTPVRLECLPFNEGAAARNRAIGRTGAEWLVMLDDDSHPVGDGLIAALRDAPPEAGAVSADVRVGQRREMGGLPEVFIGCGVAVRRSLFERLGGYDAAFGYYAEEYDLAARILAAGSAVHFDPRFRVEHRRASTGRNTDTIVERLVRNNGWVMQRYAPPAVRRAQVRETRRRCRHIARKENALAGYARGLDALRRTLHAQERTPLTPTLFDRFTGMAYARAAIGQAFAESAFLTAAVVDAGKNAWCVHRALEELGVREVDEADAEALVIGTMSPGPMLDAAERRASDARRVIAPWTVADSVLERPGSPTRPERLGRA
jgi:GT2 family glycosyltransferase